MRRKYAYSGGSRRLFFNQPGGNMYGPWDHPEWYDLHDNTASAGPEREPEHYRECLLALPPLDRTDHLIDVGAGTGKLALLIANSYPRLGQVTLIDPSSRKLERAQQRLEEALPESQVVSLPMTLGTGDSIPRDSGTVVTIGSVLMPIMELQGGTLDDGLSWLRRSLLEIRTLLRPRAWIYDIETVSPDWVEGASDDPVRRLHMPELIAEYERAGLAAIECVYRFRDRVVIRARKN